MIILIFRLRIIFSMTIPDDDYLLFQKVIMFGSVENILLIMPTTPCLNQSTPCQQYDLTPTLKYRCWLKVAVRCVEFALS